MIPYRQLVSYYLHGAGRLRYEGLGKAPILAGKSSIASYKNADAEY